jgi:quinoprotein glucose dehydrogenase
MRPGVMGGANWGGGAFDPRSGLLYVKTTNVPAVARLVAPVQGPGSPPPAEQDADFVQAGASPSFSDGLPLLKTPFGHLAAIDLNRGEIAWRVPLGDTPQLRTHPRLRGVPLPERLGAAGPAGAIVTASGLVFVGGGDEALNAVDAKTGTLVRRIPLTRRTTGTPMTYRTSSAAAGPARQFVVIATGGGEAAELVAFAVP